MQLLDEVEVNYFYYVNCLTVQINSIQTHKTNNPLGTTEATCKTFFFKDCRHCFVTIEIWPASRKLILYVGKVKSHNFIDHPVQNNEDC